MIRLLIIVAILIAVAIVLMGAKVLFVKGGKFPHGHVHDIMPGSCCKGDDTANQRK